MGSFHEDFLEDLRQDMMFYGERSVLCCYFREEKRRHAAVRERKRIYEETAVFGPYEEIAGENSLETDGFQPQYLQRPGNTRYPLPKKGHPVQIHR